MAGNISKHIKGINSECRFCNAEVETIDHLFLYCQAAQAVLFASPMNLRVNTTNGDTIQKFISNWLCEGGDHSKLKIGACLFWAIWKSRNNIIFNNGKFNIQTIIKEAYASGFACSQEIYHL